MSRLDPAMAALDGIRSETPDANLSNLSPETCALDRQLLEHLNKLPKN